MKKQLFTIILTVALFSLSAAISSAGGWSGVAGAYGDVDGYNNLGLYFHAQPEQPVLIAPYPAYGLRVFCGIVSATDTSKILKFGYDLFAFTPPRDDLYFGLCVRSTSSYGSGNTLLAVFPQSFFDAAETGVNEDAEAVCMEDYEALQRALQEKAMQ